VNTPLISVIEPFYNCRQYIQHATTSILNQTYSNFELILIDDGSTDDTAAEILKFNDKRIRLIRQENKGLAESLNFGLKIAKGEFIARQDGDDISHPQRFEKQLDYFSKNKNTALVGTWSKIIDNDGKETGRFHKHPTEDLELKFDLFFDNPFVHSSVMFRKEVIEKSGLYNTKIHSLVQDFEYWFRISRNYNIANIGEVLHEYREQKKSISRITSDFGKIVAQQSFENKKPFLNEKEYNIAEHMEYLYHRSSGIHISKKMMKEFEKIILKLSDSLQSNDVKLKMKIITKHLYLLKMAIYGLSIQNVETLFMEKLYYKIKRRLLMAQQITS